ncbi:MAG: TetR/AcrR family transcriptional regulator [Sphingomonadaceae bacterium]|nr:TetR/AcrR family transcriptional regulator [Sphingobium sp.]MBP9157935.1 TetR/AcrR family transcriptional regulator [Sphingobium sp.]MCC6481256.1 TetR/AcrR family transcriptional regulator [Sphingomonadaceae bacterium]
MRVDITDALARAFFGEWARVGYAAMSLERVAKEAGVGKAALYRRWPDKKAMACDLLARVGLTLTVSDDQETLEADLRTLLFSLRRILRHPTVRRVVTDLQAEIERTPILGQVLRPYQRAQLAGVDMLIDRAIARGEVTSAVDRETAADMIFAPLHWRVAVIFGQYDSAYIGRLARMIAAAIKASDDQG